MFGKLSRKKILILCIVMLISGTMISNIAYAYTEEGMASASHDIGHAVTDTNTIVTNWIAAGHSGQALTTSWATESRVLDYLQNDNNLWRYNNIGFGDTPSSNGAPCYGIILYNSELTSTEVANMNPDIGLDSSRVFINSCNSFMNPLHDAFISHYLNMYIGGLILLPIPDSEDTCKDFWYNYINQNQPASTALYNAEIAHGTLNDFGLYGG